MNQVDGLEILRERLTRVDGTLLDASALELRFAKLQEELVTEEELDKALRSLPPLSPGAFGELQERLVLAMADDIGKTVRDAAKEIEAELDGRIVDTDKAVRKDLTKKLNNSLAAAQKNLLTTMDNKDTELDSTLRTAITNQFAGV